MYTDSTPMPFGKHRGTALANVPADYLLWLHKEGTSNSMLNTYIQDNLDVLRSEVLNKADRDRFNAR